MFNLVIYPEESQINGVMNDFIELPASLKSLK